MGVFAPGYFVNEERELASEGEGPEDNKHVDNWDVFQVDHPLQDHISMCAHPLLGSRTSPPPAFVLSPPAA